MRIEIRLSEIWDSIFSALLASFLLLFFLLLFFLFSSFYYAVELEKLSYVKSNVIYLLSSYKVSRTD